MKTFEQFNEASYGIGDIVKIKDGRFGRVKGFTMARGKGGIDPGTGLPYGKVSALKVSVYPAGSSDDMRTKSEDIPIANVSKSSEQAHRRELQQSAGTGMKKARTVFEAFGVYGEQLVHGVPGYPSRGTWDQKTPLMPVGIEINPSLFSMPQHEYRKLADLIKRSKSARVLPNGNVCVVGDEYQETVDNYKEMAAFTNDKQFWKYAAGIEAPGIVWTAKVWGVPSDEDW